jgi:pimeloyl-ACP methyl ester carboxylesterase
MTRPAMALLIALVLALLAGGGCRKNAYTSEDRYDRGLVVCLSGAGGGLAGECQRIRSALDDGGVDRAIEIFDWSGGKLLDDQQSVAHNRMKAAELAQHIEAYQASYPGRPVHLVGISAGTGIAVWALEDLALSSRIEGAILLASSLDTLYDLAPALARVSDRIYTFNSLIDPVLAVAVPLAGTVDQEGAVAGGLVGFRPHDGSDDAAIALYRDKLVQHMWWPGDAILGNPGDHLGTTNPLFIRAHLVPIIRGPDAKPPAGKKNADKIASASKTSKAAGQRSAVKAGKPAPEPQTNWSTGDAAAARKPGPEDSARPTTADANIDESKFFSTRGDLP